MTLGNLALILSLMSNPQAKADNQNNLNNLIYFAGYCNGASAVDTATLTLRPIRPNGTFKVQINENGLYVFGIQPPVLPTDTLDLLITGPSGTTRNNRTADSLSDQYQNLQLFENGCGANIKEVIDSTGVPGTIYGIVKFDSNPSESLVVPVDLSGTKFTDFAADLKQLSSYAPGAGYTIDLRKGTAHKLINANVTEAQGMGMYAAMTAVLKPLTGIADLENKILKEDLKEDLIKVFPTHILNYATIDRDFKGFLYNGAGQRVMAIDSRNLDLRDLNYGVYFLIDETNQSRGKLIKLKQ